MCPCVDAKWCQAVGVWDDFERPLTEHWNGTAWKQVPGPVAKGRFFGVSCTSRSFCMAVGDVRTKAAALVERWK